MMHAERLKETFGNLFRVRVRTPLRVIDAEEIAEAETPKEEDYYDMVWCDYDDWEGAL